MGFSIGKVFKPIEEEMRKHAEVDSVYMPVPNYSPCGLWQNIQTARAAVKAKRYDIVHITGAEHYLIPFLRGQKVVVTVHDLGFCTILKHKLTYRIKYAFFVSSLKKADLVTFISEKSLQEAKQFVKLDPDKCAVVHNPVGKEFHPSEKPFNSQCPTVLHIGTKENKNLDRAIEALSGIHCTFRIVGSASEKQRRRMTELGIKHVVRENLTDEEIVAEYAHCDIVNFPSLYEGFGMPIIEGQASGKIVITSNREPMLGVAGNEGAMFVDPESIGSIHDAYLSAINDNVKREEIIANGFANVKKFRLQDITNRYFSSYTKILATVAGSGNH